MAPRQTPTSNRKRKRKVVDRHPQHTVTTPTTSDAPVTAFDDSPESHHTIPEDSPGLNLFTPSSTTPISLSTSSDSLARHLQASRLHHLLWNVFTTVLEPRIGLWIGGRACPFTAPNQSSSALSCRQNQCLSLATSDTSERDVDCIINRALIYAVYAYCVRWLDLDEHQSGQSIENQDRLARLKQQLSETFSAQARKEIYGVLSRPSYRSILALYLFAMIPSSPRKTDDDLEDHCIEACLSHHNFLNSRRARIPFGHRDPITSLLESSHYCSNDRYFTQGSIQQDLDEAQRLSMSNLAYWFGVISDTTRALTKCRPSILLPPGCDSESRVWGPVRDRTRLFKTKFESLRDLQTPISDAQLIEILQHAFAYKTLVWAAITRVQDALVHQMSGISLAEAVDAARKESNSYQEIFVPLLCLGLRDYMFLNRLTQMYFTHLIIHFEVGNLILTDALPPTFSFIDHNFSPYDLRLCACRSIINALIQALRTDDPKSKNPRGFNILLLDPYPDLITNAIIRTGSALIVLYEMQKLCEDNLSTMFSVVIVALETLAKISHTASEAIPLLRQKYSRTSIGQSKSTIDPSHHLNAFSLASIDSGLVDGDSLQQNADDTPGAAIVNSYSDAPGRSSFPDELTPRELDSLSQDVDLEGRVSRNYFVS
ncbi:hypothetical protein PV10_04375 [Exophiala mesophila]|uniref:Transcription factor domain-containing protein n=1 Tax=Exophiala mesophila TaxID=212818 RepID=A0A0D1ZEK5_EXOME|nr:uncharacterized protein PV10_04375 [Exophiala mesophila]KIV93137.1 hypothetical protein PV10_04375 [Exophiala mesophila]